MPKKRANQKATEKMKALDSYENWLEKQSVKPVRAKSGFISAEETEESA